MYFASSSLWAKLLSKFNPKCKVLNIGVARIFDLGAQTRNYMQMTLSEIFERETFMRQRYCRVKNQKPWPGLALNQDFAKEGGLKPKAKMSKLGDVLSKLV